MHYGVNLLTRTDYEAWLKEIPAETCPLCQWRTYQFLLFQGRHWIWIACRAPYWKYHTMFVPKRHFQEMDDMTVVEMGELIEMYGMGVEKFRDLQLEINNRTVDRYLFFWRLRDSLREERTNTLRLAHFHMHFTPDREGLLDSILDEDACDWDPSKLVIESR